MYVKVDVPKPDGNPGMGGDRKDSIIIFDWNDVASGYTRDANGIVITGPLVFNPGAYMVQIYGTKNTISGSTKTNGTPDEKSIIQTFKFTHPGNLQAIREFRWNWLNTNCGIIDRKCTTNSMDLYGSPCAPMQMTFAVKTDKDANNAEFTFESVQGGQDIAIYNGTLTLEDVTGTVAADSTTVDVTNGAGQYQLTTGSASAETLTTMTNAIDGGVYTLLGSGGAHPSIISIANDFILDNGTQWTANDGSQITFKAIKSGAATWKFVEVSRS